MKLGFEGGYPPKREDVIGVIWFKITKKIRFKVLVQEFRVAFDDFDEVSMFLFKFLIQREESGIFSQRKRE